ncbi:MAG TPA: hypothetical protein VK689_12105 [Armatimonadota bacterium]|nr:hypothetical protein [Armatimonadota bacterium]
MSQYDPWLWLALSVHHAAVSSPSPLELLWRGLCSRLRRRK